MNYTTLNDRQKKQYIKRYVENDILDLETNRAIYKIIRDKDGTSPIRSPKVTNSDGIFIDLNKVSTITLDLIYAVIKKRIESIVIK